MKLSGLLLMCALNWIVYCSHFRGATFSWAPGKNGTYITITFRISWKIGSAACNDTTIADGNVIGLGSMTCISGCSGSVGSLRFHCIDYSSGEYSSGINSVNYTPPSSVKQFIFGFSGGDWIDLRQGGGDWSFRTSVDLSVRSDPGKINSSPIVYMPPVLKLQTRCSYTLPLPVADVDGDVVKCRWAIGNECADVCQTFSGSVVNKSACTISYTAGTSTGYYVVALQIEDFANETSTTPLSSIPLQFLVYIYSGTGCADGSWFVPPTPQSNALFEVDAGDTVNVTVKAKGLRTFSRIIAMSTIDVIRTTEVTSQDASFSYITMSLTYKPASTDADQDHILCFYAKDTIGVTGNTRCITIHVSGTDNDNCDPYPCQNGATCTDGISDFNCTCTEGFTGDVCSSDIDECNNHTDNCDVNAVCTNTIGSFTCTCFKGYGGTESTCIEINECADGSNNCDVNAKCTNTIGSFTCNCIEGYSGNGIICTDIDECLSSPCQNKANCSHGINNYTCTCMQGYTGVSCETDINECGSNPCQNGAKCEDRISGYVCICEVGYAGINCKTDTNDYLVDKPSKYTVIVGAGLSFIIIVLCVYAGYSTIARWKTLPVKETPSSQVKNEEDTAREEDTSFANQIYMNMEEIQEQHASERKAVETAEEDYSNIDECGRGQSKIYETIY
ncbi:uncharacterized protein LOC123523804 [Mercenaria mercenaria]|uniref:uncharacterized protein LOC123523804 n=1 Tax=Mercenaria mercenaria TaxID=6596 RepID=UPI00234E42F4|nr:uncharacterized protein LOC123523804 [Mercenaria mercenaria]